MWWANMIGKLTLWCARKVLVVEKKRKEKKRKEEEPDDVFGTKGWIEVVVIVSDS